MADNDLKPNNQPIFGNLTPSEAGKKGGYAGSIIKKKFSHIKQCSYRCPFYDKCPYVELSKTKFDGKCAVKQFPRRLSQRTVRWLMGDEDSFIQNLMDYLMKVETNIDSLNDPNLQLRFLKVAKELYQVIFGSKLKVEADVNTIQPNQILEIIDRQLKQLEEKK